MGREVPASIYFRSLILRRKKKISWCAVIDESLGRRKVINHSNRSHFESDFIWEILLESRLAIWMFSSHQRMKSWVVSQYCLLSCDEVGPVNPFLFWKFNKSLGMEKIGLWLKPMKGKQIWLLLMVFLSFHFVILVFLSLCLCLWTLPHNGSETSRQLLSFLPVGGEFDP